MIGLATSSARTALRLRRHGVRCGVVTSEGRPPVIRAAGRVTLGRVAFRGLTVPAEVGALGGGTLLVGDRVFINQGATLVATLSISIGDDCRIGDFAAVYDSDYHPLDEQSPVHQAPVSLGNNVWLARNVIVLPGTTIGDHTVVAAGSVVRGEIPSRVLVAGAPARVIRSLEASDGWRRT